MADQILPLLVEKLLDYTAVPVGRQFSYLFCYDGNLEEFRSQLRGLEMAGLDVKLLVEAAERKGEVILPSVEDWLKRVGEVSDESKVFVDEDDAISNRCFNGPFNLKVRYQRSRKAKKKASEFDRIKKAGIFDSVSLPAPPLQIWSMSNDNDFDFGSRRSIFNEIMDAIKDDGVEMMGIWGMPGIGKTTLVKRTAKCARDEGLFDEVVMAVVSQNLNVNSIKGQIADKLGFKFTSESEGGRSDQLLQRLLAVKKILIILDDIWESVELNTIGIPSISQHKGCKIILTTRNRSVCEEMGAKKNFKIDLLSADEALDLFMRMSGVDDRLSEKGHLAENLSEECQRLPISIAIVARGLLNKEQHYWTDMLNRLRKSDPEEKVRDTIRLSYDNLHREEEKMFFLLCALFPEDYLIPVQVLFEHGLGLDLFENVDNVDEALVRAQNLASRLKSQCLLLDEDDDNFVKMHDVIRDVALAIASEGKNTFLVRPIAQPREWTKKTAISLWTNDNQKLPDKLDCPQLQILMMDCSHPDFRLHDSFFSGMKNLIVLHMSDIRFERFPQSLAALENLRTLHLSYCKLGDISAIGKLQNLVSLSFCDSYIHVLPEEVGELSNLKILDLARCRLKVITPGVIQNLSQLEVLRVDDNFQWCDGKKVGHPTNASLLELIHLSHLMILEIRISNASMLPDDLLFENLTKFKVSIGKYAYTTREFSLNLQILSLTCLSENELLKAGIKILMKKAHHLELRYISGLLVALPSHLGGYGLLNKLIVESCEDVNYVLDMTKSEYEPETPSLQLLCLIDLPSLKEISKGEFPSLFVRKLEDLQLRGLPSLARLWQFQAESNLTMMSVESCHKLEFLIDLCSAKSLSKLKELEVKECRNLQAICRSKEQDEIIVCPRLSRLTLSELENLTSFGEQVIFLALEKLHILKLERLKNIWFIQSPVESFFQLKFLELTQCPELLVVFPPKAISGLRNLEEICIESCDQLETLFQSDDVTSTVGDEMVIFPQLLTLRLINLPKFTAILSTTSQNISQATVIFPILKSIHVEGLNSVKKILHDKVSNKCFSQLQSLHVSECDQLMEVFPCHVVPNLHCLEQVTVRRCYLLGGKDIVQMIATLPKLKSLVLDSHPEPIEWSESLYRCGGFQSLTLLSLYHCNGLKSLLTPSAISCLVQLDQLIVVHCETIESIVGETSGEQNFDKAIEFSKLRILQLDNLPCLASFYNGESALKFPCLGVLSIEDCPKLKTFASMSRETREPICKNLEEALFGQQVSFGILRSLKLKGLKLIEEIWHCGHTATTVGELQSLSVQDCDRLLKLVPSNLLASLQNLEMLRVESCRSLEHVLAVEDQPPLLSSLSWLQLNDLPELKQLWWNKNLMNVDVENCSSIVEIVAEKPGKKIEFPLLDTLYLVNLPRCKVKKSEFPQASTVLIYGCFDDTKESCSVDGKTRNLLLKQRPEEMDLIIDLIIIRHESIHITSDRIIEIAEGTLISFVLYLTVRRNFLNCLGSMIVSQVHFLLHKRVSWVLVFSAWVDGQIADEIGLTLTSEGERGRVGQLLQRLLARKKILIMLDDIWDRIELSDIGIPSASQHKGCKIILTTRKIFVCEEMGTGKNFSIDLLSENDELDLFLQMSGLKRLKFRVRATGREVE